MCLGLRGGEGQVCTVCASVIVLVTRTDESVSRYRPAKKTNLSWSKKNQLVNHLQ